MYKTSQFCEASKGKRRSREGEHCAYGVVAELWISSYLHCTQVSELIGCIICACEFHFRNGGCEDLGDLYCCSCRRVGLV